ncbi:uncharacterized protein BO97DRAFT_442215 [Aspergillus homomorphus CBS 101889]|uniref:GPI anchored protein n=1 Tax=Aspergillus homomorphus (strain CBS 101889) TaxID=1450537 RepID=A0A395I167_ASPHC|nr:hypothetical protein BO97DRAFT_442215 [Aspergillus homomorphus CBS 101889]RAL13931.1 hypothetical protein BO97DRAFT_442215 [Aspergillus homomorphus CBS 101889]
MMPFKLVLALAATTLVSGESVVTTLFMPDTDSQTLVASVMGVAATATTYYLTCPAADSDECGMGPGMTVIAGPQTTTYLIEEPDEDVYMSMACSVQGTTSGVCIEMISGTGADFPGTYTRHMGTDDLCCFMPVTITAGAASVASATSPATAATASATATAIGASTTASSESASDRLAANSAATSAASTASQNGTAPSSTGAGAFITNDAAFVMGGAAVAGLVAAFL